MHFAHADADGRQIVDEEIRPVIGCDLDDHVGFGGAQLPAEFAVSRGQAILGGLGQDVPIARDQRRVAGGVGCDDFSHARLR
ncbi:MAG: hypothetical protein K0Q70_2880 [Rhodospirillales bacterium]|nr:hypothetical protein [Rhodospirillales bacterium]